jgi:hypothetical protein
MLMKLAI